MQPETPALLVTQGLPEALEQQEKPEQPVARVQLEIPELPATQVQKETRAQKESRMVALSLSYRLARLPRRAIALHLWVR